MARLKCNVCGTVYSRPEDLKYAESMRRGWAKSCRGDGIEPQGICPCPSLTCQGELVLEKDEAKTHLACQQDVAPMTTKATDGSTHHQVLHLQDILFKIEIIYLRGRLRDESN